MLQLRWLRARIVALAEVFVYTTCHNASVFSGVRLGCRHTRGSSRETCCTRSTETSSPQTKLTRTPFVSSRSRLRQSLSCCARRRASHRWLWRSPPRKVPGVSHHPVTIAYIQVLVLVYVRAQLACTDITSFLLLHLSAP